MPVTRHISETVGLQKRYCLQSTTLGNHPLQYNTI